MPLSLVPAIHRATHRIGLYLAALRENALSQGEAHILAQLADRTPQTIAELHEGLAHKRSTLTSILDRLADRAFITREVGTSDRRTFVIDITPKGRSVAQRVRRHLVALEETVRGQVTASEFQACLKVLGLVEEGARQSTRAGRTRR